MEQSYLEILKIVTTHGLRGDVKVVPWTDYPEIFEKIKCLYTKDEEQLIIKSVKYRKNTVILNFDKIDSIEKAQKYINTVLYVKREDMPELEEGSYYIADIIGLDIYDNDQLIGKITDVISSGAADIYEIKRKEGKNVLFPAAKEFIKEVDLKKGVIIADFPKGLIDL